MPYDFFRTLGTVRKRRGSQCPRLTRHIITGFSLPITVHISNSSLHTLLGQGGRQALCS